MKLLISLVSAAQIPILFWVGGFDFNQRGEAAFWCYCMALMVFGFIYSLPSWTNGDKP